ncbi:MAG TPA: hypothetical protein VIU33_08850 [Nitrospiria bacterium]
MSEDKGGKKEETTDKKPEEEESKAKKKPELILPIVPDDSESLEAEMSEIFEEDSVKHQHGGTEPESD